ncbi:PQQ-binding-like beta-propeller repeat protein, partial [candidate division WOR-3 bacterium]|nr:PQQ-binding-like beta-propeller repeat protein [candidate division WOR-3 bacterium]MBD3365141.1 PQQ-binding-like beta-propeller repeat protein [candidate division WOR-3 bacterium]
MPDQKKKAGKEKIPVISDLGNLTDKAVKKIETSPQFKYGCTWSILLILAYLAFFALVLFFLNKDLNETARTISHGKWTEAIVDFFTVMLPVVLLDIAVILLGLLMFVPVGKIATSFVLTAPSFGFKKTWPAWLAVVLLGTGIAASYFINARKRPVIIWEYKADGKTQTCPVTDKDGNIYFVAADNYLYSVNSSGLRRWRYSIANNMKESSPVLSEDGLIYFGSDDTAFTLTPNGNIEWSFEVDGKIATSPVIDKEGMPIYIANKVLIPLSADIFSSKWMRVKIYAFDSTDQPVLIYEVNGKVKTPSAIGHDGILYFVTAKGHLFAVRADSTNARMLWKYPEDTTMSGEVLTALVVDEKGIIYFGTDENYIYAVGEDGRLRWRYEAQDRITSSPVIDADGTVYFGCRDKHLYALTPVGDSAVEPEWIFPTGGYVESTPAIGTDGIVYF